MLALRFLLSLIRKQDITGKMIVKRHTQTNCIEIAFCAQ